MFGFGPSHLRNPAMTSLNSLFHPLISGGGTRRDFLAVGAQTASAFLLAGLPARRGDSILRMTAYPFTLDVASGDPRPDGVVLWTRLAPDLAHGGGVPPRRVAVRWEVSRDEGFRQIVQQGQTLAVPELAHSVHAEVRGLEAARPYWYRFISGDEVSPAGRTVTAPRPGMGDEQLRFAFVSCQKYEDGYFTAYRHLAAEELNFVVHLGDYIYESAMSRTPVRPLDDPGQASTLQQFRARYALYKQDPDLQAAHASFPFVVTWDDHEVENDYAGIIPEPPTDPVEFLKRRAAAYQAYYEHTPLRPAAMPRGPNAEIFRRLSFGGLAEFHVLDTRQYRSDQPCGGGVEPLCPAAFDPRATMLGATQEQWLMNGLQNSRARWNVLANQVPFSQVDFTAGPETALSMDKWDGYPLARQRLLDLFAHRACNPIIITGDVHNSLAADVKSDFRDPASATLGVELIGTSIASGGDGAESSPFAENLLRENPHLRFFNGRRGYVRCTLTADRCTADFQVIPFVSRPGAPVETRASFVVENGRPGLERV